MDGGTAPLRLSATVYVQRCPYFDPFDVLEFSLIFSLSLKLCVFVSLFSVG